MNNIIIEKTSEDKETHWLNIKIRAVSNFIKARVNCSSTVEELEEITCQIKNYIINNGKLSTEFSFGLCIRPSVYIRLLECKKTGHLNAEVTIDIDDSELEYHKCCFFIDTEIGAWDQFEAKIKKLVNGSIGTKVSLYD